MGEKRFTMRPGLTGLAQVLVRNSVSWDERIKLDIEYVDSFNIWLILKFFRTFFLSPKYLYESRYKGFDAETYKQFNKMISN